MTALLEEEEEEESKLLKPKIFYSNFAPLFEASEFGSLTFRGPFNTVVEQILNYQKLVGLYPTTLFFFFSCYPLYEIMKSPN